MNFETLRVSRFGFWIIGPVIGGLAGLLYTVIFDVGLPTASAVRGIFIGAPILFYERGLFLQRLRARIRHAATPLFAAATVAIYVVMIVIGNAIAGSILHRVFGYMPNARVAMMLSNSGFAYSLAISALAAFVFRVRDLIGPRVFTNLLLGRYHHPISEERIFLFLDVVGSTRFAELHGDLAAQKYLGAIFGALAGPVARARGSIDDYVGDMALVSWTIAQGARDAACLRCVFDFAQNLRENSADWQAQFGQVPEFRAALHCGSVVTAEVGLAHRKIAYFGDTLNTTSRLESLAKELRTPVLVSRDLLKRLGEFPRDLVTNDLGSYHVRGRQETLCVAAVQERSETSLYSAGS
ncbi:adenylate/guanylate cyclase domain-containing protein [Methylobacterium sp. J-092]|uniref:adenylate/guanylate cyclase domain-containing protein n=1 Tax=Methylobacterium sp. J-092 TaxID=2836667 RepID=UPI001FBADBFE|nr:adenylate/guanylate cyclase domain-containing protein [Methylobacterium sp. J-092]MCJ2006651.1 adenylate/guanylate cyclase domain-containing protein [Methylobacterium sp. J-092]